MTDVPTTFTATGVNTDGGATVTAHFTRVFLGYRAGLKRSLDSGRYRGTFFDGELTPDAALSSCIAMALSVQTMTSLMAVSLIQDVDPFDGLEWRCDLFNDNGAGADSYEQYNSPVDVRCGYGWEETYFNK